MDWFICSAAIGSRLDVAIGSAAGGLAVLAACVPAWLAVRDAIRHRRASIERPRLRVIDGRYVFPRRATWATARLRRPVRT